MDIISFPVDIKLHIASYFESVYINFVIYDIEFRNFAYANRQVFIKLFNNCIYASGISMWKLFGKLNRPNDLPAMTDDNIGYEMQRWYYNDKLHRVGKPAVITKTYNKYYYYGEPHRGTDCNGQLLPAVEYADGKKLYYINGFRL